jgi:hypothetical protein
MAAKRTSGYGSPVPLDAHCGAPLAQGRLGVRPIPAQCPDQVGLAVFSFGQQPSLCSFLRPSQAFVRLLRRYYAAARLPEAVHLGLIWFMAFTQRSADATGGQPRGLPVLAREVSIHAWGLRLRRVASALAFTRTAVLLSVLPDDVSTLIGRFRSSLLRDTQPAYAPIQHFGGAVTVTPHGRGQDGSLLLSCMTLSFTTSRRFIPAIPGTSPAPTILLVNAALRNNLVGAGLVPARPAPSGAGNRCTKGNSLVTM